MSLDPQLWAHLEEHGVREEHMAMLLRLLQIQRNGWWGWQYVNGMIQQCDARLVFPSRGYEVARVSDALLGGESVLR